MIGSCSTWTVGLFRLRLWTCFVGLVLVDIGVVGKDNETATETQSPQTQETGEQWGAILLKVPLVQVCLSRGTQALSQCTVYFGKVATRPACANQLGRFAFHTNFRGVKKSMRADKAQRRQAS